MESVLRLKVRAIGTGAGAGSRIGKERERELGWDRGAHYHSFCLRYTTKVVQVQVYVLRTDSKYIYLTLRSNEHKSQEDIESKSIANTKY